jgi:hypothetical protein
MSELGGSHAPTPPPVEQKPAPDGSSDIPMWVVGLAAALALGLATLAGVLILRPSGPELATLPTPTYPKTWDPRIAPIAEIASDLRGLDYVHPVDVRFLTPAKFEKELKGEQGEVTQEDQVELEHATALLRALGLLSGDVDLRKAVGEFEGGAVLAYYSFDDEEITVRGKKITPAIKATLVHELTHVLQDQRFGVGDRIQQLQKESEKDGASGSAMSVLQAIVEGDAERIRYLYQGDLPARQREALTAAQDRESTAAKRRIADVPPLVVTMLSSPYVLGPALVEVMAKDGGNGMVDTLFENPPVHDSALFDPYRVVSGQAGAKKVAVPKLGSGEKEFESGELGALSWYFMLAERLPLAQAMAAADGWGGDAYVAYDRGDSTCAELSFAGRTPADTARMEGALRQWAAASPGDPAVTTAGKLVQVASCDPGTNAAGGVDTSSDAMTALAVRAGMVGGFKQAGLSIPVARCAATRVFDSYTAAQVASPTIGTDPEFQALLRQLVTECR